MNPTQTPTKNRTGRAAYVLGSVLLGSSLVACGGGESDEFVSMTAEEIVSASIADMESLTSVAVDAEIENDGMTIGLDLQLSTEGDCTGTVALDDAVAEVLSVDGMSWFKADAAFFSQVLPAEQVDQVMAVVDGKFIADEQGQFTDFCDLEDLLDNITDFDEDDDEVSKGEETDVDGEDVIVIDGENDEGNPSQAFIATGENHYILKFTAGGDEPGEVTFTDFDEDVAVEAPADEDVVDLGSLG